MTARVKFKWSFLANVNIPSGCLKTERSWVRCWPVAFKKTKWRKVGERNLHFLLNWTAPVWNPASHFTKYMYGCWLWDCFNFLNWLRTRTPCYTYARACRCSNTGYSSFQISLQFCLHCILLVADKTKNEDASVGVKAESKAEPRRKLCAYSQRVCNLEILKGFDFCHKHILEDKASPFKPCDFVAKSNGRRCPNPAQKLPHGKRYLDMYINLHFKRNTECYRRPWLGK